MANFLDSTKIHSDADRDFQTNIALNAETSFVASGMVNGTFQTVPYQYHFDLSAYPGNSNSVSLYERGNVKFLTVADGLTTDTPSFVDADHSIWAVFLNESKASSTDIEYVRYDTQSNYITSSVISEYNTSYNAHYSRRIRTARVPLLFVTAFNRLAGKGNTPLFAESKPIGKITKLFNRPLTDVLFVGPTYIIGSCQYTLGDGNSYAYPAHSSGRMHSQEMFFHITTDQNAADYGCIYVHTQNCRNGSLYHVALTSDELRYRHLELAFKTTLYVTFQDNLT